MKLALHPTASLRPGAVMPLFALLLPVVLMLCGLAINVSYLRLARTELKIASDATVHAAGRAMSLFQTTDDAIRVAKSTAGLNTVSGQPFSINDGWIQFGMSTRGQSGFGRYVFQPISKVQIDNGQRRANSIGIAGSVNVPVMVRAFPGFNNVNVGTNSIATQVDRDIALVLDRSGSMLWYKNRTDWNWVFDDLRSRGRISSSDRTRARNGWGISHYASPFQTYPNNNFDSFPNGGSNPDFYITNTVWSRLTSDRNRDARYLSVYEYIFDSAFVSNSKAPRHSRWSQLELGVDAFLNVLDSTDQEELVSLAVFSSSASVQYNLSDEYADIRGYVTNHYPLGSTAIGQGIQVAVPSIMTGMNARPFAAKTLVILTDGENNVNPNPVSVATSLAAQYNLTIHTVTFTPDADKNAMRDVATAGGGKHYHADTGEQLIEIFEEIANNLPTILTE